MASGREFCEGILSGGRWPSGEVRGGSHPIILALEMRDRHKGQNLEKSHKQDVRAREQPEHLSTPGLCETRCNIEGKLNGENRPFHRPQ